MTIRTILVDDEPLATQGLRLRLEAHEDVEIVATRRGELRDHRAVQAGGEGVHGVGRDRELVAQAQDELASVDPQSDESAAAAKRLLLAGCAVKRWMPVLGALAALLRERFGIAHATLQPEPAGVSDDPYRGCMLETPAGRRACLVPAAPVAAGAHAGHRH